MLTCLRPPRATCDVLRRTLSQVAELGIRASASRWSCTSTAPPIPRPRHKRSPNSGKMWFLCPQPINLSWLQTLTFWISAFQSIRRMDPEQLTLIVTILETYAIVLRHLLDYFLYWAARVTIPNDCITYVCIYVWIRVDRSTRRRYTNAPLSIINRSIMQNIRKYIDYYAIQLTNDSANVKSPEIPKLKKTYSF